MPATITAQDVKRLTKTELVELDTDEARAELDRRKARKMEKGKAYHEAAELEVEKALDSVLNLFESDELPAALSHAIIRRQESDAPSSSWSLMNNLLMILGGTLDARGRRQWQKVGREVVAGASPIFILGPKMTTYKVENEETGELETRRAMRGFVAIPVFRVEDTTGDELEVVDYTPASLPPLFEAAAELGVSVRYVHGEGSPYYGYYEHGSRSVTLMTADESTFYHELAHAAHDRVLRAKGSKLKGGQDSGQEIVAELSAATLGLLFDVATPGDVRRSGTTSTSTRRATAGRRSRRSSRKSRRLLTSSSRPARRRPRDGRQARAPLPRTPVASLAGVPWSSSRERPRSRARGARARAPRGAGRPSSLQAGRMVRAGADAGGRRARARRAMLRMRRPRRASRPPLAGRRVDLTDAPSLVYFLYMKATPNERSYTMNGYEVSEIRATEASGPGALDGFEATCSCGLVMSSSLRSALEADVASHSAWHSRRQAEREVAADYVVLDDFDSRRRRAGHDYGNGQRVRELRRLARQIAGEHGFVAPTIADLELTGAELVRAFERVGRPKVRRIEARTTAARRRRRAGRSRRGRSSSGRSSAPR